MRVRVVICVSVCVGIALSVDICVSAEGGWGASPRTGHSPAPIVDPPRRYGGEQSDVDPRRRLPRTTVGRQTLWGRHPEGLLARSDMHELHPLSFLTVSRDSRTLLPRGPCMPSNPCLKSHPLESPELEEITREHSLVGRDYTDRQIKRTHTI